jgi:hypothetical protein
MTFETRSGRREHVAPHPEYGPFRHGQHVTFRGEPGFVIAGFNAAADRIIVAKTNPRRADTQPQHFLAEVQDLAEDTDWLRRRE